MPAVPIADFMSEEAKTYEECPMFHKEFNNPKYKFLSWEMEVGDALVHHPWAPCEKHDGNTRASEHNEVYVLDPKSRQVGV